MQYDSSKAVYEPTICQQAHRIAAKQTASRQEVATTSRHTTFGVTVAAAVAFLLLPQHITEAYSERVKAMCISRCSAALLQQQ